MLFPVCKPIYVVPWNWCIWTAPGLYISGLVQDRSSLLLSVSDWIHVMYQSWRWNYWPWDLNLLISSAVYSRSSLLSWPRYWCCHVCANLSAVCGHSDSNIHVDVDCSVLIKATVAAIRSFAELQRGMDESYIFTQFYHSMWLILFLCVWMIRVIYFFQARAKKSMKKRWSSFDYSRETDCCGFLVTVVGIWVPL